MFPHWKMIPYTRPHGGIVIGKGGHHIKFLSQQMGCQITTKRAEPERKRFKPYFLIEGYNERSIFMAAMKIQELLMESMMTMDQKRISDINDLGQQNQYLNLVVADKDDQIKQLEQTSESMEDKMDENEDDVDEDDEDDEDDVDEDDVDDDGINIAGLSIN